MHLCFCSPKKTVLQGSSKRIRVCKVLYAVRCSSWARTFKCRWVQSRESGECIDVMCTIMYELERPPGTPTAGSLVIIDHEVID